MPTTTHLLICPLCEATCGLSIQVNAAGETVSVRGDADDVFSAGYACPKGLLIGDLHHDPDRLRTPLVDGRPASWEQAWQAVHDRIGAVIDRHGRERLGIYLGNPNVHNLAGSLYAGAVIRAMGSRNVFSASTSDQMPKQVAALLMFGDALSVPIPDVDRTDLLVVVLGADPLTSNGSLLTAPDLPGRLRALRRRGGRLVVIDPRSSRTARVADQHLAIRPGADAFLLAAIAQVLIAEGLAADPGPHVRGLDDVAQVVAPFTPEAVESVAGLAAGVIRRLAPRVGCGRFGRRLRADRHLHRAIRHGHVLVDRRRQRADGQPGHAGRGDVPAGTRRAAELLTRHPATRPAAGPVRHGAARVAGGAG
jgi:anaerobic selenocysteine-containing dehydrogenase